MTQQNISPGSSMNPGGAQPPPVGDQMKDAAQRAKGAAGQVMEQAEQAAGKVVGQAKEQATSRLASQKDRAAGSLGAVAQAIRQTGQGLRDQDQEAVGRYADTAAQQVERVAGYLRDRDVSDLVDDVEDLARRQPGLFLGGAVALGFLGTRFLMSSGRRAERRERALAAAAPSAGGPHRSYRPESYRPAGGQTGAYGLDGGRPDLAGTTSTGTTSTGAAPPPRYAMAGASTPGESGSPGPSASGTSGSKDREAA